MAFQRCFLQLSKQFVSRSCLLQSNIKQTYCELHHQYSKASQVEGGKADKASKAPRLFSNRHEWVVVDDDIGTVGISKYAQESLGDVVFAQLPEPKNLVYEGVECGALESVKAASEIYSPVTGIVTEINKAVEKKPSLINTNCYDKGWLFKLKLTKLDELMTLMTEEQYKMFLKTDVEEQEKEKKEAEK